MSAVSSILCPVTVRPDRLIQALKSNGWEVAGFRENRYVRLKGSLESGFSGPSVVVPLNRDAVDFDLLMNAAFETIRKLGESHWIRLMELLFTPDPVDRFRFRRETSTPRGLIPWRDGVQLIDSARRALIAGAKAYMEPSRHYSNRFGQFASRYLAHVLMGQSSTGSYVVNALVPTEAKIPIRKSADPTLKLDIEFAHGRDITSSCVRALEGTTEALKHFRSSGSMSGFEDRVNSGVSYELVMALRDVASGADQSGIKVELANRDQESNIPSQEETHSFEFTGGDVRILDRASTQLSASTASEHLQVRGRVHLLTRKEAGGPGVVGIDDGKRRYRVRFGSDEEYHRAVLAHYKDSQISVEGDLSREGTLHWLYNAELLLQPGVVATDSQSGAVAQQEMRF